MNKAVLFIALFLFGCAAPAQWSKPGYDPIQFDKDIVECEYEARKAVPDSGYGNIWMIAMERSAIQSMCMETKGYER